MGTRKIPVAVASYERSLIAAITVTLLAVSPASADTKLRIGKASVSTGPTIVVDIGDQAGIFRKHGLDLEISGFSGGNKMTQAMAAGALDIDAGGGTDMALVAKGAPMLAVCEISGPIPFISIGVPWDSPVQKVDDLKGKVIGVSST